jgi:hypothetical protein
VIYLNGDFSRPLRSRGLPVPKAPVTDSEGIAGCEPSGTGGEIVAESGVVVNRSVGTHPSEGALVSFAYLAK